MSVPRPDAAGARFAALRLGPSVRPRYFREELPAKYRARLEPLCAGLAAAGFGAVSVPPATRLNSIVC